MGIALNLESALVTMDILTIVILPIHEHRISLRSIYLCLFKFLSSVSYSFQCTGPSSSYLNLFTDILFFLMPL